MKHGQYKQHTGEEEEKDIDCLNQHSDVPGHTHSAFAFMKPQTVRAAPHWVPERITACTKTVFHSTSINFKVALANIHLIKLAQFLHVSHEKNDVLFLFLLHGMTRWEAGRTSGDNASITVGSQPAVRSGEGAPPSAFYAWPLRAPNLRTSSTNHLYTTWLKLSKTLNTMQTTLLPYVFFVADSGSVKLPAAPTTVWWRITADFWFFLRLQI